MCACMKFPVAFHGSWACCRLRKELWSFTENRIAARFSYEYHDAEGQWFRAYGNEVR